MPSRALAFAVTFALSLSHCETARTPASGPVAIDHGPAAPDPASPPSVTLVPIPSMRAATMAPTSVRAIEPDAFAAGEVDVVTIVKTAEDRKAISPLIYGINGFAASRFPADVLACITLVRRGGDRGNSYNWETNVSNGSLNNDFENDMTLGGGTPDANAPAAQDLALLAAHRPAGRALMVPFVLNDWVAGPLGPIGAWNRAGWNRSAFFRRVGIVKDAPFSAVPDLRDGMVYTDEHLDYLMRRYPGQDVTAPGPGRLFVGIDNEPDLYPYNFPMLQSGSGAPLVDHGHTVGTRVTSEEFTARTIAFAKKVKQMAPQASVVGPSHYNFDGFTNWWDENTVKYGNAANARWYMDDFLRAMKVASEQEGTRLLETWDFHWYPQGVSNGTYVWNLDNDARPLTASEVQQVVQGVRSYWDPTYDEQSWITQQGNLGEPTAIIPRLKGRIAAAYPGTKLGITEYNPGGRHHIASGLAVADSLGVFQRQGIELAAFWPEGDDAALAYVYGAFKLLRNADGSGVAYAGTDVRVEHPEFVETAVYAGSDSPSLVTMLVINKTTAPRKMGARIFHALRLASVAAYRIDAAHPSPFFVGRSALEKANAYAYAAPPLSATLLVFRAP